MLIEHGHFLLEISIILLILQLFFNFYILKTKILVNNYLIIFLKIYFIVITISMSSLFYEYILSNFYIINIIEHSHSQEALLYKFCGLWGNHEGSMLLWCWVLSCYAFLLVLTSENCNFYFLFKIVTILLILNLFFICFTFFTSNPFLNTVFLSLNGTELNPILQDPGLAIHPPLLYLGYIGSSLIYSILIAYMITPTKNNFIYFINLLKKWTILSWSFLTIGITLGSWWAYYELGWGGWWFWDPVENASLIPWLSLTALIHSILMSYKQNKLHLWTIILIIFTFFNSLSGTFFVRSGLLTSVHSFAQDHTRGTFILIFLLILLIFTVVIFLKYLKQENFKSNNYSFINISSKDFLIYLNNLFLLTLCITIIFGSFGPVLYKYLLDRNISIGAPFYNNFIGPLMVPFLILMILSTFLNWKKTTFKYLCSKFSEILYLIFFTIPFIYPIIKLNISIISSVVLYLCVVKIFSLIYYALIFKKFNNFFIGHLGFIILIIAIIVSSNLQIESIQLMKPGDVVKIGPYEFIFRNINYIKGLNYNSFYGDFLILNDLQEKVCVLFPEKRFYLVQGIFTTKAAIYTNLLMDFYAIIDDGNLLNGWYTRFYYSPLMPYLWVGPIIMLLSGLLIIYKNYINKNKKLYWI